MKRKRGPRAGDKKGKRKELLGIAEDHPIPNVVTINTEDNSILDEDYGQLKSNMEIEAPSLGPENQSRVIYTDSNVLNDKPTGQLGHGRVKVRLKSSKLLEPHRTFSDAQTQSDTDKSNPETPLDKHGEIMEKLEDSANSMPETPVFVAGKSPKKAGSIKIKSSRGISSSNVVFPDKHMIKPDSPAQMQSAVDSLMSREPHQKTMKLPHRDYRHNEKELSAALGVIKKIMKMDAAEPFNTPVNPVALGIPDYFDIIKTPMDFGTICNELEHGNKYMNSKDVLKDVEFIWTNCYRYNNKGDYILDLMKRVKKVFLNYWMAAGLYYDLPKRINDASLDQDSGALEGMQLEDDHGKNRALEEATGRETDMMTSKQESIDGRLKGIESIQVEDVSPFSQEKRNLKGNSSKHKSRRRHGINLHKGGCLCAVCVLRRRRQEREENARMVETQIRLNDVVLSQELKQEENSPLDNPGSEDASSNLDRSTDLDADADVEEGEEIKRGSPERCDFQLEKQETSENDTGLQNKGDSELSEQLGLEDDGNREDSNQQTQAQEMEEDSCFVLQQDGQKDDEPVQQKEGAEAVEHLREVENMKAESWERNAQIKINEDSLLPANPLILQLCGTLFSSDPKSSWSGPHSLIRRHMSARDSPIHAVVAMFMK
eukprot:TRINITY_DN5549_c0_g1_i1.p1 TRINITY_DN5549_c0_g1~~TRINITY_DN5549_c0_g1_i1.p1  ORF type:complete len:657 (+),score=153.68 TRINITY_DN5549_c0_g1_i1:74-2044(+)